MPFRGSSFYMPLWEGLSEEGSMLRTDVEEIPSIQLARAASYTGGRHEFLHNSYYAEMLKLH